jgi:hypothetical protein
MNFKTTPSVLLSQDSFTRFMFMNILTGIQSDFYAKRNSTMFIKHITRKYYKSNTKQLEGKWKKFKELFTNQDLLSFIDMKQIVDFIKTVNPNDMTFLSGWNYIHGLADIGKEVKSSTILYIKNNKPKIMSLLVNTLRYLLDNKKKLKLNPNN